MEDAGTSEEDDIDSQNSNIRIDHGSMELFNKDHNAGRESLALVISMLLISQNF